jgi:hypothetical protein
MAEKEVAGSGLPLEEQIPGSVRCANGPGMTRVVVFASQTAPDAGAASQASTRRLL